MKKISVTTTIIFVFFANLFGQKYEGGTCQSGDCSNGKGTFIYESGDIYVGAFNQGKRNGYGEYTFKNGTIYKGNWKNNLKEDKNGEYISKSIHYTGSFRNDYIDGTGTVKFLSEKRKGDSYTGNFVKNKRRGNGEYYYDTSSDKVKYIGEFENDKFNGQGVLTFKNKEKWDGLWKEDVFQGTIIGTYNNNSVYKKGDTIVTYNNAYLLSKQTPLPKNGYDALLNENVLQDGFYIEIDTKGKKQIIGYVTTTSQRSNSTSAENERFAKSSLGHKFYEKKEAKKVHGKPIGKYNNEIVYQSNDSIIVADKIYRLILQPKQYAFSNKATKYSGNIKTRYFIMYDRETLPKNDDFRNESIIGWVDDDYKNTYTFTQRKGDRVEGLNLFGSIYIGPNNPTYPNGKIIYTLPAQDNVDAAALEHDKCYDSRGAAGEGDAIFNTEITDCDTELVMRCLATMQIHVENNATQSAIDMIKGQLEWGKISSIKNLINHEQITDPIQRAKYVATFFLAASTGKGWGLIFNEMK